MFLNLTGDKVMTITWRSRQEIIRPRLTITSTGIWDLSNVKNTNTDGERTYYCQLFYLDSIAGTSAVK